MTDIPVQLECKLFEGRTYGSSFFCISEILWKEKLVGWLGILPALCLIAVWPRNLLVSHDVVYLSLKRDKEFLSWLSV